MSRITEKMRAEIVRDLLPVTRQLRAEGLHDWEIASVVKNYRQAKIRNFYSAGNMIPLSDAAEAAMKNAKPDSKAEVVFLKMLEREGIPFKFQVKIGRYRVDYLIGGSIVFEGDGPQHAATVEADSARDRYLESMGYTVFRMRWEIVAMVCDSVIQEIRNELGESA